jgi:hypothetical protein
MAEMSQEFRVETMALQIYQILTFEDICHFCFWFVSIFTNPSGQEQQSHKDLCQLH